MMMMIMGSNFNILEERSEIDTKGSDKLVIVKWNEVKTRVELSWCEMMKWKLNIKKKKKNRSRGVHGS
jgi:hypothetical protein